jgi:ABC-2 type transport system permease protein
MKSARLGIKIVKTLVKDRVHYPGRLAADTFAMIARCGVLLLLYSYVFKLQGGQINGVGFDVVAWSIFFYFSFSMLRLRDISKTIMHDVQTGNIEVLFNKPISYLSYRSWWHIGSGIYSFLVVTTIGTIALYFFIGFPETMKTVIFLPSLMLVMIGAGILTLVLYAIVGVLAFWIEDINPVFWVVDKAVMILGGSYLPVALFPEFMKKLALYSPFGASQFITHTPYESWASEWLLAAGIQIFWIAILGVLLYILFLSAQKKISINGG